MEAFFKLTWYGLEIELVNWWHCGNLVPKFGTKFHHYYRLVLSCTIQFVVVNYKRLWDPWPSKQFWGNWLILGLQGEVARLPNLTCPLWTHEPERVCKISPKTGDGCNGARICGATSERLLRKTANLSKCRSHFSFWQKKNRIWANLWGKPCFHLAYANWMQFLTFPEELSKVGDEELWQDKPQWCWRWTRPHCANLWPRWFWNTLDFPQVQFEAWNGNQVKASTLLTGGARHITSLLLYLVTVDHSALLTENRWHCSPAVPHFRHNFEGQYNSRVAQALSKSALAKICLFWAFQSYLHICSSCCNKSVKIVHVIKQLDLPRHVYYDNAQAYLMRSGAANQPL